MFWILNLELTFKRSSSTEDISKLYSVFTATSGNNISFKTFIATLKIVIKMEKGGFEIHLQ